MLLSGVNRKIYLKWQDHIWFQKQLQKWDDTNKLFIIVSFLHNTEYAYSHEKVHLDFYNLRI